MNVKAIENRYQIEVKPGRILINRLRSRVRRFERKHATSSSQMLDLVRRGTTVETEEISRWMQNYLVLEKIRNGKKQINTAGIH